MTYMKTIAILEQHIEVAAAVVDLVDAAVEAVEAVVVVAVGNIITTVVDIGNVQTMMRRNLLYIYLMKFFESPCLSL
jgi:hypothetical protein